MKLFPVTYPTARHFREEVLELRKVGLAAFVIGVPWDMIAPHEAQAQANYGTSLSRLADPGLSAPEVVALLLNKARYDIAEPRDQAYNHKSLLWMIQHWETH